MSEAHYLDANVILRFLLADDPVQSPKAKELFELAQAGKLVLCASHVCLAEATWVLFSYYNFERSKLAQTLREFVLHDGVNLEREDVNPRCIRPIWEGERRFYRLLHRGTREGPSLSDCIRGP